MTERKAVVIDGELISWELTSNKSNLDEGSIESVISITINTMDKFKGKLKPDELVDETMKRLLEDSIISKSDFSVVEKALKKRVYFFK